MDLFAINAANKKTHSTLACPRLGNNNSWSFKNSASALAPKVFQNTQLFERSQRRSQTSFWQMDTENTFVLLGLLSELKSITLVLIFCLFLYAPLLNVSSPGTASHDVLSDGPRSPMMHDPTYTANHNQVYWCEQLIPWRHHFCIPVSCQIKIVIVGVDLIICLYWSSSSYAQEISI